jgi:uncharacterized membrane protein
MLAHRPAGGTDQAIVLSTVLRVTDRALRAAPYVLAAGAAVGYAIASTFRHDHFGSNAYDLGIFDQTIWGYSRFEALPNTVVRLPNLLGDHFHPILVTLAPLYWIWDDPRVLLLAQAVLLAAAGLPIFLWARRELGFVPALVFELAYLVFWAVLAGSIFDFHELAFAAPIVSLGLYAALTRRAGLLWLAAGLALLTREDLALTFAALGLYVALVQRRFRLGLSLSAACLVWFGLAFKVLIPAFADRDYAHWWYSALGSGPGDALLQLVTHPVDSVRLFFTPRDKQIALFNLFAPWLVLPLFSPLVLVLVPGLGARFFSDNPSHWAPQGFHYSLVLAPALAFAAIDTTVRLTRLVDGRAAQLLPVGIAGAVLLAGLYFSFGRLRPLDELERYATGEQRAAIRACLDVVPPDASVAATSALVPHLSHRRKIFVLDRRPVPRTRFLAIDTATWIFPLTRDDLGRLIRTSFRRGYGVRCSRRSTVVLEQGAPGRALSPELRRLVGQA